MWVPCNSCEEFWCTDHGQHASECPCPPIEEWERDPYSPPSAPADTHSGTTPRAVDASDSLLDGGASGRPVDVTVTPETRPITVLTLPQGSVGLFVGRTGAVLTVPMVDEIMKLLWTARRQAVMDRKALH